MDAPALPVLSAWAPGPGAAPEAAGAAGCRLTLQAPCYVPLLQYASDRAFVQRIEQALPLWEQVQRELNARLGADRRAELMRLLEELA